MQNNVLIVGHIVLDQKKWYYQNGEIKITEGALGGPPSFANKALRIFNEEATIVTNVRTLLALKYPEYEVIVVNDGSTDSGLGRLVESFRLVEIGKPIKRVLKHAPIRRVFL